MKKKKSAQDILVEGIKNMPPIHVAYLMQRLQHDTKELINAIPSIYDKDREDMAKGKIGFFSPDFYVTYANNLIQIFNKDDNTDVSLVKYQREEL
jgi:hypothetical protein